MIAFIVGLILGFAGGVYAGSYLGSTGVKVLGSIAVVFAEYLIGAVKSLVAKVVEYIKARIGR